MTKSEYQKITTICDRILNREVMQNPVLVAISWLHVIDQHPCHIEKYKQMTITKGLSDRVRLNFNKFISFAMIVL